MTVEPGAEIIVGGVIKDAAGNIIDDSSEKAAQARLAELGIENVIAQDYVAVGDPEDEE
jgi:hypothetical protein